MEARASHFFQRPSEAVGKQLSTLTLASLVIIQVIPREAGDAAGTNVGQNQTGVTGGAGEGSSALAASAGRMASYGGKRETTKTMNPDALLVMLSVLSCEETKLHVCLWQSFQLRLTETNNAT